MGVAKFYRVWGGEKCLIFLDELVFEELLSVGVEVSAEIIDGEKGGFEA